MFAQMKGRSRSSSTPCPCGGTCSCHAPIKNLSALEMIVLWVFGISCIVFVPVCVYICIDARQQTRTIDVRGETCVIQYKQTGISSTGVSRGYDTVICRSFGDK
jgi:hypothetical protein